MISIPEPDWKLSKTLQEIALQRFFEKAIAELEKQATTSAPTAQERFWKAFEFADRQRKQAASLFDNFRRSTAIIQLACMYHEGLLTPDEIYPLTQKTRDIVQNL